MGAIAITLPHNLLHYKLLLTCLKNMARGLLVLTWLSLAVGINSKGCSQPRQGRWLWFLFQVQGKATSRTPGQVQAALCLLGCEGRGQQGTANRMRQFQLGTTSPCPKLWAVVPPGPGPCAGAASHEASWAALAWPGTAQSPTGTGKEAASPGSSRIYCSQEGQSIAAGCLAHHLRV